MFQQPENRALHLSMSFQGLFTKILLVQVITDISILQTAVQFISNILLVLGPLFAFRTTLILHGIH